MLIEQKGEIDMEKNDALYVTYQNWYDLEKGNPVLATELLENFGEGEWQNNIMNLFDNLADFAKHEITDGWYSGANLDRDWNGAPSLINFIDYESLGIALERAWDDSDVFKFSNEQVIFAPYGWYYGE